MLNTPSQKVLTKNDLISYFLKGAKNSQKIGLEYEKIGFMPKTYEAVPFGVMEQLLEKLSEFEDYSRIFNNSDEENLIGLKNCDGNISLEPGCQFELSLNPCNTLKKLDERIKKHNELIKSVSADFGIKWLGAGLQPLSTFENIKIIPKNRYEIMTQYLPQVGQMPLVMMRETAGIQVGIDYFDEDDAIDKLRLSLKLAPIVSAVFSNSPVRNGKLTGYKSFRAKSWTQTDEQRCGLIDEKLFDKNYDFNFEDYVNKVCSVQMIMVNDGKKQISVHDFSFNDFMNMGYKGKFPSIDDFEQHISLIFTDTRIKNYLEIRNHDSQKEEFVMCVPAFWKAIMYDGSAFEAVSDLLKEFEYQNFENLRQFAPKYGLDCNIGQRNLKDIAKEIFEIAYMVLKQTDEEKFLEPIYELVQDGITPADLIIKNFEGVWLGNIEKFVQYLTL